MADIGDALVASLAGAGHRLIAARLGLPPSTVRGWLRRFTSVADGVREHFTRWAMALDPLLGVIEAAGSRLADALGAIAAAVAAAIRRFGPRPAWSLASALSAGRLLSNTNCPWAAPV